MPLTTVEPFPTIRTGAAAVPPLDTVNRDPMLPVAQILSPALAPDRAWVSAAAVVTFLVQLASEVSPEASEVRGLGRALVVGGVTGRGGGATWGCGTGLAGARGAASGVARSAVSAPKWNGPPPAPPTSALPATRSAPVARAARTVLIPRLRF